MTIKEVLSAAKLFEQAPGLFAVLIIAAMFLYQSNTSNQQAANQFKHMHEEMVQARAECRKVIDHNTQALATFTEVFRVAAGSR